ncbi:Tyrosine kinase receptor Cad96Ca [Holothuria leucospilota]|uniref:Tyrosine kinase receptor Cad96Ca n=1 Tax=Holothuria leucospilota TaxID=206669 RepID=A0A9Q1H458_HOLLE|nr:Tyrosine kinase receptor Cad96Ca [Holothuria leucospilota]
MNFLLNFVKVLILSTAFREVNAVITDVATYESKAEQPLECTVGTPAAALQWVEDTGSGTVAMFSYIPSTGYVTRESNDVKYNNFDVKTNMTSFDLTINNVERDDGGYYQCIRTPGTLVEYRLNVEALPLSVSIICKNSVTRLCGGPDETIDSEVHCKCTATGVLPRSLQLLWSGAPNAVTENGATAVGDYFDLTSEAVVNPVEIDDDITCKVTGYQSEGIQSTLITNSYNFVSPFCSLEFIYDDQCMSTVMQCNCNGGIPDIDMYSFSFENKSRISDSQTSTMVAYVIPDKPNTFYCRGCNGIDGLNSVAVSTSTCESGEYTTYNGETVNYATGAYIKLTGMEACSSFPHAGLVIACCIEAVTITALVVIFVTLHKLKYGTQNGYGRRNRSYRSRENGNHVYMDLQEATQPPKLNGKLEIPLSNVRIKCALPGKGLISYHKADLIQTSQEREVFVKSFSDNATVRMEKLQNCEVEKMKELQSNVNIVEFIGFCRNVPVLLIYEFVNGRKLTDYFRYYSGQRNSKQYINTGYEGNEMPNKESPENLTRLALQTARGMTFLTARKFLHPGLRLEKVIIDVSGQCKLFDFVSEENAREFSLVKWNEGNVPYQWMPPEYLFLQKLDAMGDVWSFAVMMWEMFSYGMQPHEGCGREAVEKKLRERKLLNLPANCPGAIWQVILTCWEQSPEQRPSFEQLSIQLSHMCNENKEYEQIKRK